MTNAEFNAWKREQIAYFSRYLHSFNEGTEEYHIIKNGIAELEKTL